MRTRTTLPLAAAALLLAAQPAAAGAPGIGAPGIGDAYYPEYGNGGYDVSHYDIRLTYRPDTDRLEGTTTVLATATQDLARFDLDFALDVGEVLVDGRPAAFAATGEHELEVTPAAPLSRGQRTTVVVRYAGTPSAVTRGGVAGWLRTPDGGVAAGEPEAAWWWFPGNDHPADKATFDVSVLVPDGTQVISNGDLVSQTSRLGRTRFTWRQNTPQATYLATLAVGRFDVTRSTSPGGIPVLNAYSPDLGDHAAAARASVERTGELADWLTGPLGPYPFGSVGGYVPNVPTGYALETQTRVFYSPRMFARGSNTSVVVHELAHQWFGDSVSVRRWSDIWLNEGFATYAQWLWSEHEHEGTAQELADWVYTSHPADDPFWTVLPGDPGPERQFDEAVYDRGALALHALRHEVGDEAFFRLLRGWPAEHRHGNASVADFRAYAERVSGRPLEELFRAWLYTSARPDGGAARTTPPAGAGEPRSWAAIHAVRAH